MRLNDEKKINQLIPEAERMAAIAIKRGASSDTAFTAAMNWLTHNEGLRVLTDSEKAFAVELYGGFVTVRIAG